MRTLTPGFRCSATSGESLPAVEPARQAGKRAVVIGAAVLLVLTVCGFPQAEIISVEISPPVPITSSNEVSANVTILTYSAMAQWYRPPEVAVSRHELVIGLYPTWGMLAMIDVLSDRIPIGRLPAGLYRYTVAAFPEMPGFGEPLCVTGSFAVVPWLHVSVNLDRQIFLRWDASDDFVLQARDSLAATERWEAVPVEPESQGPYLGVQLENPGRAKFFRLVSRSP